jgi:hypothetical protein
MQLLLLLLCARCVRQLPAGSTPSNCPNHTPCKYSGLMLAEFTFGSGGSPGRPASYSVELQPGTQTCSSTLKVFIT